MRIVDEQGERYVEPGSFTLFVGGSQPDERSVLLLGKRPLSAGFRVK